MNKKLLALLTFSVLAALPVHPQGPPFVAGLNAPTRMAFTQQGNIIVAESGVLEANTGRISIIDRATATRRTLVDGLPSAVNENGGEKAPSGPSGVALSGSTLYVSIGAGDVTHPGPVPGSEAAAKEPSSPILVSLLSIQSSTPLDLTHGGFTLTFEEQLHMPGGGTISLTNAFGERLDLKVLADFPDFTPNPRPDFPDNVRAGNPFGVAILGSNVFVVDASQNLIRRVDANSGTFTTLATFPPIPNPTPIGAPFIDAVPDSVRVRGNELLTTTLTGFPFPAGAAEVRRVDAANGSMQPYRGGLTSLIDVAPLGNGAADPVVTLEFSTDMRNGAPGRLQMVPPSGPPTFIADGLPTPSGLLVDQRSGEIFVSHIFPGFITRIDAAAILPPLPPPAIIPAVISANSSVAHYVTSMQISNPYSYAISGRLIVHPSGPFTRPTDPSLAYTLAPFETRSFPDFIASAGSASFGTVDVVPAAGGAPITITNITNVANPAMPVLGEPQVSLADALLTPGSRVSLVVPADTTAWRLNVGIRTIAAGLPTRLMTMTVSMRDSSGTEIRSVSSFIVPNTFQQFSATTLFGGGLPANGSLVFSIDSEGAVIYGACVNNNTGEMTLQIPKPVTD